MKKVRLLFWTFSTLLLLPPFLELDLLVLQFFEDTYIL